MKKSQLLYRSFNWIFLLLSMALLFRLAGSWHNTLSANGNWKSEKMQLPQPLPGASGFFFSPLSLRGEALHLGAWGGHQAIDSVRSFQLDSGELSFDCYLGFDSYIILTFSDDKSGKKLGLRLSRNSLNASAIMQISPDGSFHELKKLEFGKLSQRPHFVKLVWKGDKTELSIDRKAYLIPLVPPKEFHLGFIGNNNFDDSLDNIRLRTDGKHKALFHDGFLPNYGKPLSAALFLVFFILVVVTGLLSDKTRFLANLSILVMLFFAVVLNEKVLLIRYPILTIVTQANERERLITNLKTNSGSALVLVGGSQLSGAGAFTGQATLEALLRDKVSKKIQVLNLALVGQNTKDSFAYLREFKGKVKLLVVSADAMAAFDLNFLAKVKELSEIISKSGGKILLVSEPRDIVSEQPNALAEFARVNNFPFLDLQKEMDSHSDQGLLWWDLIHLSAYGQELEAAALLPVILPLLR